MGVGWLRFDSQVIAVEDSARPSSVNPRPFNFRVRESLCGMYGRTPETVTCEGAEGKHRAFYEKLEKIHSGTIQ